MGPDKAVEARTLAAELLCGRAFGDGLLRVCQEGIPADIHRHRVLLGIAAFVIGQSVKK
jgi:hypothetical protein